MGKHLVKKLEEDDILEIVMEHFQESNNLNYARGKFYGEANSNLRFVGIFGDEGDDEIKVCDLEKLDETMEFNGDHELLKSNPLFQLNPSNSTYNKD